VGQGFESLQARHFFQQVIPPYNFVGGGFVAAKKRNGSSALLPEYLLISLNLTRTYLKIEFSSVCCHTREGGYPSILENNGFPSARE
jgi:hypothetical protein